jgi:alkylation response protein AidB-like acyl-CoA dehydrogenase
MNFAEVDLSTEEVAFWREVHRFMEEHVTEDVVEDEFARGSGMDEAVHLALGERGWLMPSWTKERGGIGASPVEQAILELELSAHQVPMITAGTTRLVVPSVARWGDPEVRDELLSKVARGTVRFCLGYTEPDAGSDLAAVTTRAERDGDEWIVTGQKMFTTGAQNCQYAFLLARTNPEAPKHKGLTMFLVPLTSAGVEISPVFTIGRERTNIVYYDGVRFHDRFRVGDVDRGWEVLNGPLGEEHEMGRKTPFDASPGGEFTQTMVRAYAVAAPLVASMPDDHEGRAARLRLARVALNIELSGLASGLMGRIATSELLGQGAVELLEAIGMPGLLGRHADGGVGNGVIEYAHRYAQGTATFGGTTNIHRNLIAEHVLGLPRSRPARAG